MKRTSGNRRAMIAAFAPLLLGLWMVATIAGCGGGDKMASRESAKRSRSSTAAATPAQSERQAPPAQIVRNENSDRGVAATKTAVQSEPVEAPKLLPVTYEVAEKAYHEKRYEEATDLFARYCEAKPSNPWGHYMLGLSSWKAGRLPEAEAAFARSLEIDAKHVKSLLNGARVFLEEEKPQEALAYAQRAVDLRPESGEAHRVMGRVLVESGDREAGADAYRRAIVLDDRDAWAMNNLGLLLIQDERFEEALPVLARAAELREDVAVIRNNLGVALERLGGEIAAADAYRTAVGIDEDHDRARGNLARVEARSGGEQGTVVDLAAASERFQREIEAWRASSADTTPEIAGEPDVRVTVETRSEPVTEDVSSPTEITLGDGSVEP